VEDSGLLGAYTDGVVMSTALKPPIIKPFLCQTSPFWHGVYHPNLYLSNLYSLKAL